MTAILTVHNLKDLFVDSFESQSDDARFQFRKGSGSLCVSEVIAEQIAATAPSSALESMRAFMDDSYVVDPLEQAAFQKLDAMPVAQVKGVPVRR